jgi:methylenetetrahydrofolate dehydrogenase (NADP+)/methenyltetrahydrofolate cyclohydrolase/formyltetrahydrofolate synthetase/formate--tetrahydrofolate ligase
MLSDIEIVKSAKSKPINEIASKLNISEAFLIPYGKDKAKVDPKILKSLPEKNNSKYILVTAINPTPLGEGKTTTLLGLTQGFGALGYEKVTACIRQPSLGPTFNVKGGAAGGGYSQAIPMEDMNLHFTGDMHAISITHNLIAASLDTRMFHESRQSDEALKSRGIDRRLNIDPNKIFWNRVLDLTDRSLRDIHVGLNDGKNKDGTDNRIFPRETGFEITPASEIMAVLALSLDLKDLKERLGRMILALNKNGDPISVNDLGITGSLTVLLKDALKPNLIQTLEGQPVFVHCGPFANIAHGNSSIIADKIALKTSDYVLTEAGFGADIGAEKFFNIKCRYSGLMPDAVVLVATIRALKLNGGGPAIRPGIKLPSEYTSENLELLEKGLPNLGRHIDNMRKFGVNVVVAINVFPDDNESEIEMLKNYAIKAGALDACKTTHFSDGGEGAKQLARAVVSACDNSSKANLLYKNETTVQEKIELLASELYKAGKVEFSDNAKKQIEKINEMGYANLPVCIAKTPASFSHDPKLLGIPEGFTFPIRDIRLSAGAGFIYALAGDIMTMPGMITNPNALKIDIDTETEEIFELS